MRAPPKSTKGKRFTVFETYPIQTSNSLELSCRSIPKRIGRLKTDNFLIKEYLRKSKHQKKTTNLRISTNLKEDMKFRDLHQFLKCSNA